ncbi:TetR/AcrR family transcriptional regulator [uncultured Friedmanniella sp.]|uniref:TetR/AcrR family transcriptional regulator n=1 Tax=uncultured Friedmanniella sp. TaxID=335381 RepID=UPI0035CBB71C
MSSTLPRSRTKRSDVREQVLRAAATAFAEHSYAEVSVTAIAAAAGFTKGAVYSNFGGKPELFAAVFASEFTGLLGNVLTLAMAAIEADGATDPAHAVGASLAQGVADDQRLPALLAEFRALAARDPELARVYGDLRLRQRRELEQLLTGVADRVPLADGVDVAVAATLLLTCVNGVSLEYAAAPHSLPLPLIEAMLTHVMTGILA